MGQQSKVEALVGSRMASGTGGCEVVRLSCEEGESGAATGEQGQKLEKDVKLGFVYIQVI